MAFIIPIEPSVPNQEFSVPLDGVTFILRFFWNERDESWYWELYDSARVAIWCGARIAVGQPLLRQCVNASRPAGELVVVDTSNEDEDPGLDDLGDAPARVQIHYLTAAEMTAAGLV